MSLATELADFRDDFMGKVPAEIREAMTHADTALANSGLLARGGSVRLATLLARGPVVLSFYRGGWCPYCNLELRALQRHLPEFAAQGATLVAVSPQTPDESLSTAERNELLFPVLSDTGSRVAKAFGIAFDLDEALRPIYTRFGHALPEKNGDESWTLPVPATFVIDRDARIALAFVDVDYRNRLEPAEILKVLRRARRASA